MIREDNVTLQTLTEDLTRDRVNLKEYLTRKEGSALFTVAINKLLLNKYKSWASAYKQVFQTVRTDGKDIRFPNIFGVNPRYIPELAEVPFSSMDITSTTVVPVKFGLRMGLSNEMIDDNEVSLMEWTVSMVGTKMAELQDAEAFKMLDTHQTGGAAVDGTIQTHMGAENEGAFYTTATYSNDLSASATEWETLISTAINQLKGQTVALRGRNYRYPVYADTIICNSYREIALKKVLNATITVMATGLGDTDNAGVTQLAGTNMFKGMLNIVASPYVGKGQAYITQRGRSLVFVDREPIRVERETNWAYEAQEAKAITRFRPDMIDEKGIFAIYLGTA